MQTTSRDDKKKSPAEQFLLNAFRISVEDRLDLTGVAIRSLWGCMLQSQVKQAVEPKQYKKISKRLKELESHPSNSIECDIYHLCRIYVKAIMGSEVVLRFNRQSTMLKLNTIERDLRYAMDEVIVLCGEISEFTDINLNMFKPKEVQPLGVGE